MVLDVSYTVVTPREKMATFLSQVVDEYRDCGYVPVGYGPDSEYQEMRRHVADVTLEAVVDDQTADFLAAIWQPLCVVVLAYAKHEVAVDRIKMLREREDDVFVRYFPYCDVTR